LFQSACHFVFKNFSQIVESEAWKKFEENDPMLALKMLKEAVFNSKEQIGSHIIGSESWKELENKDAMLALKLLKNTVFNHRN